MRYSQYYNLSLPEQQDATEIDVLSDDFDSIDANMHAIQDDVDDIETRLSKVESGMFYVGATSPTNTHLLWIDTTSVTGGLKYHNGTNWVTVPVRFA